MERRRSKRLTFNIAANVTSAGNTFTGSIENVSEEGVEYLLTSLVETSTDFIPEKIIDLKFKSPSGKTISMKCEVKWFLRASDEEGDLVMGMKIINPPSEYTKLIKSLDNNHDKS